jgi:hypothetical protein
MISFFSASVSFIIINIKYLIITKNKVMAKAVKSKGTSSVSVKKDKGKVSRPGIHAKTKTSKLKNSKNYKKINRGQG